MLRGAVEPHGWAVEAHGQWELRRASQRLEAPVRGLGPSLFTTGAGELQGAALTTGRKGSEIIGQALGAAMGTNALPTCNFTPKRCSSNYAVFYIRLLIPQMGRQGAGKRKQVIHSNRFKASRGSSLWQMFPRGPQGTNHDSIILEGFCRENQKWFSSFLRC